MYSFLLYMFCFVQLHSITWQNAPYIIIGIVQNQSYPKGSLRLQQYKKNDVIIKDFKMVYWRIIVNFNGLNY